MLRNLIFSTESEGYKKSTDRVPRLLLDFVLNSTHFKIDRENVDLFLQNRSEKVMQQNENGWQEQTRPLTEQLNTFKYRLQYFYPTPDTLYRILYDLSIMFIYASGKENYVDEDILPQIATDPAEVYNNFCAVFKATCDLTGVEIPIQKNFDLLKKALGSEINKRKKDDDFNTFKPEYFDIYKIMQERN